MADPQSVTHEVDLDDLCLDTSNYRFPASQPTEREALSYLFAEHDVMSLARVIIQEGYVANELPIVTYEHGRLVVLEGNRRLSALRGLMDPELVTGHTASLERLRNKYPIEVESLPTRISVMRVRDRSAAAFVLARLHIGEPKKPWNIDEQATFVLTQLKEGLTASELQSKFPAIKSVVRLVRIGSIREMLRSIDFGDPSLNAYASGPSLRMTSFEYAYRIPEIQAAIGIAFDEDGRLTSRTSTPGQVRALARLLQGFKRNELNTRRGLKREEAGFADLLREMLGDEFPPAEEAPQDQEGNTDDTKPADTSDSGEGNEGHSTQDAPDPDTPAGIRRGPNSPHTKGKLDFSGIDESALPVNLKYRLQELRRINVLEFPAASAILMRSALEAVIKHHYGLTGPQKATGMLSEVMQQVATDYSHERHLLPSIGTIKRAKGRDSTVPGTGTWFNFVAHSVSLPVKGQDVHDAWRVVAPLITFLLDHSPVPDPAA